MLVITGQYSYRIKALSVPHITLPESRLGVHKKREETQDRQLIPADRRDISYRVKSCSVYKSRGKLAEGLLLRDWLGTVWLVMSNCFSFAPLSFLGFYFSVFKNYFSFSFIIIIIIIITIIIITIIITTIVIIMSLMWP